MQKAERKNLRWMLGGILCVGLLVPVGLLHGAGFPFASRGGRGFFQSGPPGSGDSAITPPFLDLETEAQKRIEAQFDKAKVDSRAELDACVVQGSEVQMDMPDTAFMVIELDRTGIAKATSLRLQGAHHPSLQTCLWQTVSKWRFVDLPTISYRTQGKLSIRATPHRKPVVPIDETTDLSQGLITLESSKSSMPLSWHTTAAQWVADLAPCFEVSWQLEDYQCEGPLQLDITIDDEGRVLEVKNLRWTSTPGPEPKESGKTPSEELKSPVVEAVEGEEGTPTPAPNPLVPKCGAEVASCLVNTLYIWQLPPAEQQSVDLRLMIQKANRTKNAAPPDAWDGDLPETDVQEGTL